MRAGFMLIDLNAAFDPFETSCVEVYFRQFDGGFHPAGFRGGGNFDAKNDDQSDAGNDRGACEPTRAD